MGQLIQNLHTNSTNQLGKHHQKREVGRGILDAPSNHPPPAGVTLFAKEGKEGKDSSVQALPTLVKRVAPQGRVICCGTMWMTRPTGNRVEHYGCSATTEQQGWHIADNPVVLSFIICSAFSGNQSLSRPWRC